MTDLNRLTVSLTKHNAHKVASLIKKYPIDQIFSKLGEVSADPAQTRKNLSALPQDVLPPVWAKAKSLGPEAVDGLMFVGIVFSHHSLIEAMTHASHRNGMSGTIERDVLLRGKEYTNFARVIDQLGFAAAKTFEGVTFNLRGLLEVPDLGPLVAELLALKLSAAQWAGSNSLPEEAAAQGFHAVLGISEKELTKWLTAGTPPTAAQSNLIVKDEEFFQDQTEGSAAKKFDFKSGHTERDVEPLSKSASPKSIANQLHNDLQNRLYLVLKDQLGADNVGTEQDTGGGTAIDVATRNQGKITFYEIKTGASVRTSIRQALPQLLEYSHWPDEKRADDLVVVSHLPITKIANRYLEYLRKEYKIPIRYAQFDIGKNELIE